MRNRAHTTVWQSDRTKFHWQSWLAIAWARSCCFLLHAPLLSPVLLASFSCSISEHDLNIAPVVQQMAGHMTYCCKPRFAEISVILLMLGWHGHLQTLSVSIRLQPHIHPLLKFLFRIAVMVLSIVGSPMHYWYREMGGPLFYGNNIFSYVVEIILFLDH